jgi:hypothetical protein
MSNNIIALLALIFMLVSVLSDFVVYREAKGITKPTGQAFSLGYVQICINQPPIINISCAPNATAYRLYHCHINATDPNADPLTFRYNSSVASGNSSEILFTPTNAMVGRHIFNITVDDNLGCANSIRSKLFNVTVHWQYPLNITGYQPNGSKLPSFPKVNLQENKSLKFNVSFLHSENESVTAYWLVNLVIKNTSSYKDTIVPKKTSYVLRTNFSSTSLHNLTIRLKDPFNLTSNLTWKLNVTNVNRRPRFIVQIPAQDWYKDQSKGAFYLNDFVYDPDTDDTLSFNITYLVVPHYIFAQILPGNNYVIFSQPAGWIGTENVYFTVTDNWGASDNSNNVTLSVVDLPPNLYPPQETAGSGGGGKPRCIEEWFCQKWGPCVNNKTMTRRCLDLNNCGTNLRKPNETSRCVYIPQCYDGIQNQNEDGIDCGGPCPPCSTCFDRIQNQGEDGVDCGGPCDPCLKEKSLEIAQPRGMPEPEIVVEKLKEGFIGLGFTIMLAFLIVLSASLVISKPWIKKIYRRYLARAKVAELVQVTAEEEKLMHEQVLQRLDQIESSLKKASVAQSCRNLSAVTRQFFKLLLKLDYEFTYEELKKEILSRNIEASLKGIVMSFFSRVTEMEYGNYSISKAELQSLVDELREIVKLTTKITEAQTVINPNRKEIRESNETFGLISEALEALRKDDLDSAKAKYKNIMLLYKRLPDDEKKKIYVAVKRLLDEINLAARKR